MSLARLRKKKNIAVVVGPHKLLSIRSICQMENTYIQLEKSSLPLDCCISLVRLEKYRCCSTGFAQKIEIFFQGLFKDFSRTKIIFQGPFMECHVTRLTK